MKNCCPDKPLAEPGSSTSRNITRWVLLAVAFCLAATPGCFRRISYGPDLLAEFQASPENSRLEFSTPKGRQVAFYLPPLDSPEKPPKKIAILFPGITALALGWLHLIDRSEYPETGYLLVDYPGRGFSDGTMRPEKNYQSVEGALRELARKFGVDELDAELNLLGHSFGTGMALQFAERAEVRRVVLVAPFNTLRKAVAERSLFLSLIMPSRIDNREAIQRIFGKNPQTLITIIHGTRDTTLPVQMGRELAGVAPGRIVYHEFADDDHTSVLAARRDLIFRALNGPGPDGL